MNKYLLDSLDRTEWLLYGQSHFLPRVTTKLQEKIDVKTLENAMLKTQKRYFFLQVKCVIKDHEFRYVENDKPFTINKLAKEKSVTVGETSNDYPWQLNYYDDEIIFTFFHGLFDGQGAFEIVKTLIYYYFYEKGTIAKDISNIKTLNDDLEKSTQEETELVMRNASDVESSPIKITHTKKVDVIDKKYITKQINHYELRINSKELREKIKAHDTTPLAFLLPLFSESIRPYFKKENPIIKGRILFDMKKIVNSKSLRNAMDQAIVFYDCNKHSKMKFENVVTAIRSKIDLQMDYDVVIERMKATNASDVALKKLKFITIERNLMRLMAALFGETDSAFLFSNVGKITFPDEYNDIVLEVTLVIPPVITPIVVEMVGVGDVVIMSIVDKLNNDRYLTEFMKLLEGYQISSTLERCGQFQKNKFESRFN